jgi:hypothetical protein
MYCPECKCEYLEGYTHCADCNVPLVEGLPEGEPSAQHAPSAPIDEKEDLVLLKRFPTTHEAQLARGFLVSNGIEAVISGEDWLGIRRNGVQRGGVKLFVRKEDQKEAEDLFRKSGITTEQEEQQRHLQQSECYQPEEPTDDYRKKHRQEYAYEDSRDKRGKAVAITKIIFIIFLLAFILLMIKQFFL